MDNFLLIFLLFAVQLFFAVNNYYYVGTLINKIVFEASERSPIENCKVAWTTTQEIFGAIVSLPGLLYKRIILREPRENKDIDLDGIMPNFGGFEYSIEVYKDTFDLRKPLIVLQRTAISTGVFAIALEIQSLLSSGLDDDGSNVISEPIGFIFADDKSLQIFAIATLVLIFIGFPIAANIEELVFRNGTKYWWGMIWRSIVFGLIHTTSGMGIIGCFIAGLMGVYLTIHYWIGGTVQATRYHFLHNFWVTLYLVVLEVMRYVQ